MTKQAVKRMIKAAKKSAKDKALETAARLGKPTSTGVVTGLGLSAILAALGALHRDGSGNGSLLSNPAVLAALGATGGYLAGNALHTSPSVRDSKEMSALAALGLLGGVGTFGTMLAKQDARALLEAKKDNWNAVRRLLGRNPNYDLTERTDPVTLRNTYGLEARRGTVAPLDKELFNSAKEELSTAYRRTGDIEGAIREAMYERPTNPRTGNLRLGRVLWDKIRNSSYSPWRWLNSLNPLKKEIIRAGTPVSGSLSNAAREDILSMRGLSGRRLLSRQILNLIRRHRVGAGIGALALLAGGGKAIYDYMKD